VGLQHSAGNQAVQQLLHTPARVAPQPENDSTSETSPAPGRPLDPALQAEMRGHLGGDFSQVRIHDDAAAARSADAYRALAYTVGQNIFFAGGKFAPHTWEGRRLLAHELTHTLQQGSDGRLRVQRQPQPGSVDVDIEPTNPADAQHSGLNLPTVGQSTWLGIGGSPYATLLPGFKQNGDSCGAASLVTALLIWDREHWDPAQPNSRIVDACDLILLELERHGADAARRWAQAHPIPECEGDASCNVKERMSMRDAFATNLTNIRDAARTPGGKVTELEFQVLGLCLYFLWNHGSEFGLDSAEIFQIKQSLGLNTTLYSGINDFDEIFTDGIVTALAPDEMAQVFWVVASGQQHAFIIGRLSDGKWFLTDQGPGVSFQADTLPELHRTVRLAAESGGYWLFVGSRQDAFNKFKSLPGYLGVQKLAPATGTHQAVQQTIPPGSQLGQVDAGYFTIGDDISVGSFVGRAYTLADAQAMLPAGAGGGVIVELPAGVFTLYTTSAVSEANIGETSLDASDSAGMLLGGAHIYHHAWLILGNRFGIRRSWWKVY
jgi:hypothetical protein